MEQAAAGGGWRKGPWTPQEDKLLFDYITQNGEGRWSSVFKCTGLKRSGKSCRLRWVNYLRPGLKKGQLTPQEEGIIIELHALWGNKWSTIARYLPGRTDNEIKNYWRTHFKIRKPSHHLKQVEKSIINVNHKLQQQQQQSQTDSRDQSPKMDNINGDEEMSLFPSIDNQQFLPSVYQETAASDFIPFDCYLWGGLWNLDGDDDLPNICAKMPVADENQANSIANYYHPFEGDAVDYVQSAEIFL